MKIALTAALPAALVLSLAAFAAPAVAAMPQPQAAFSTLSGVAAPEVAKKGKGAKKSTKGKKARARNR